LQIAQSHKILQDTLQKKVVELKDEEFKLRWGLKEA
jgi:hypothetical protein